MPGSWLRLRTPPKAEPRQTRPVILHFESGVFYQWMEGPQEAVQALFEAISHDPRHKGVVKLSEIDLTERNFKFWSMAVCQGDG